MSIPGPVVLVPRLSGGLERKSVVGNGPWSSPPCVPMVPASEREAVLAQHGDEFLGGPARHESLALEMRVV